MREPNPQPVDPSLNDELRERYRDALEPKALELDEARLLFEAGRAAALPPSRSRLLTAYSGVMTAVAAGLAAVLAWPVTAVESAPPAVVAAPERPAPPSFAEAPARQPAPPMPVWLDAWLGADRPLSPQLALRRRVMREGIDALPEPDFDGAASPDIETIPREPATVRRLLEEYLPPRGLRPAPRPDEPSPEADLRNNRPERVA